MCSVILLQLYSNFVQSYVLYHVHRKLYLLSMRNQVYTPRVRDPPAVFSHRSSVMTPSYSCAAYPVLSTLDKKEVASVGHGGGHRISGKAIIACDFGGLMRDGSLETVQTGERIVLCSWDYPLSRSATDNWTISMPEP